MCVLGVDRGNRRVNLGDSEPRRIGINRRGKKVVKKSRVNVGPSKGEVMLDAT